MKHLIYFFFIAQIFCVGAQTPANDSHWQLLWADEFNGPNGSSPDPNKWHVYAAHDGYGGVCVFQPGPGCPNRPYNLDLMPVVREANTYLENGAVVFRTVREATVVYIGNGIYVPIGGYECPPWALEEYHCKQQMIDTNFRYKYSTGAMDTKQDFNIRYGYIEARMKVSDNQGSWPAFWTYGARWGDTTTYLFGLPNFPVFHQNVKLESEELDFEFIPGGKIFKKGHAYNNVTNTKYHVTTNIHAERFGQQGSNCEPHCSGTTDVGVHLIDDYTQWHIYGFEWTPDKIIYYIDGNIVRVAPNPYKGQSINLLHVLKLGAGINSDYFNHTIPLPCYTYVDYIRVYKPINDCGVSLNSCTFNWSAYDNKVKKNITIGAGGCTNVVPSSTLGRVLRAAEFIHIQGDFSVPLGNSLYLDVNSCYE